MGPDVVLVGRRPGGGCVQDPVQVIGVVLTPPAVVACGPVAGRRW